MIGTLCSQQLKTTPQINILCQNCLIDFIPTWIGVVQHCIISQKIMYSVIPKRQKDNCFFVIISFVKKIHFNNKMCTSQC